MVWLKADKHVRLKDVGWLAVLDWRRLKPEQRVNFAVDMSDVCIMVCAEGVKAQNPRLSDEALIELVRERLMYEKNLRRGSCEETHC
ncbi:MAG: hypothetical protein QXG76_05580 [Candidatus Bathyarchaeia archaeon]